MSVHSSCLNLEPTLQRGFLWTGCPLVLAHLIASGNDSGGCGDQLDEAQQPPRLMSIDPRSVLSLLFVSCGLASQALQAHSRTVIFLWLSHLQKDNKVGD